jgi:hypothetical protein
MREMLLESLSQLKWEGDVQNYQYKLQNNSPAGLK